MASSKHSKRRSWRLLVRAVGSVTTTIPRKSGWTSVILLALFFHRISVKKMRILSSIPIDPGRVLVNILVLAASSLSCWIKILHADCRVFLICIWMFRSFACSSLLCHLELAVKIQDRTTSLTSSFESKPTRKRPRTGYPRTIDNPFFQCDKQSKNEYRRAQLREAHAMINQLCGMIPKAHITSCSLRVGTDRVLRATLVCQAAMR
jgi:hypothetical protein